MCLTFFYWIHAFTEGKKARFVKVLRMRGHREGEHAWQVLGQVERGASLGSVYRRVNNLLCTLPNNYSNMKIITMEAG